jgi:hypothetical protein
LKPNEYRSYVDIDALGPEEKLSFFFFNEGTFDARHFVDVSHARRVAYDALEVVFTTAVCDAKSQLTR